MSENMHSIFYKIAAACEIVGVADDAWEVNIEENGRKAHVQYDKERKAWLIWMQEIPIEKPQLISPT